MSYSITPYKYLRRYTDGVPVKLGSKFDEMVFFVEIHKYRNNGLNSSKALGCKGWTNRRGKIRKAAKAAIAAAGGNTEGKRVPIPMACTDLYNAFADRHYDEDKVMRTYTGKGSPEDISETLSAAVALGVLHPDELWSHADSYIGLDCNGYVGNWAKQNRIKVAGQIAYPNRSLLDYASTNKDKKRTDVSDLRQGDVLVWVKSAHIALVEMVVDEGMGTFIVCESSATFGGLHASFYQWTERTKDVEDFRGTNRLLNQNMRNAMKADLKDGKADLKNGAGKIKNNWIKAAKSYGEANRVRRMELGSGEWVSAHGLTNVHT